MSALRKIQVEETGYPVANVTALPTQAAPAARPAAATESHLKQVALFVAAPFIGLLYAVLLPFVGLGLLATLAARAFNARYGAKPAVKTARQIAMLVAAPFIGLAYIVAMPLVGIGALVWIGAKAAAAK